MAQKLIGLEYLKANKIEKMECNADKPFAFFSYSHDDYDSQIVMNLFKLLYESGYNIWIDTANMPYNENDWKMSANKALRNKNCKFAFFFRSESSMSKDTIATELANIKRLRHMSSIVSVDIWHEASNNAEIFYDNMLNDGDEHEYSTCQKICDFVSLECKALRLREDMGNDINKLAEAMKKILERNGVCSSIVSPVKINVTIPDDQNTITVPHIDTYYVYKIFGKEYYANEREQGKLMYDAFSALTEKYPEKAGELTKKTSVARAEDVINANTKLAKPVYFRACRQFTVGEHNYYVGTSYSFDAKLAEIKGMFKICGADPDEFVIIKAGEENISQNDSDIVNPKPDECYVYKIFGKEYYANEREQGKLMYDAFSVLTEKYPEKVEELTKRTSIARAEDVTNANTKLAKPIYFKTCRQFTVRGHNYYVGASYGFDAKLAEIKGMFKICGADPNEFVIISAPEKAERNNKSRKTGIGELL